MKKTLLPVLAIFALISCSKDETKTEISPVSEFTYSVNANNKKIINFQNASHYINSSTKYLWSFGDGDSSLLENPQHTYLTEGDYSIVLKVTNGDMVDCSDQKIKVSSIVSDSTAIPPVVSFVYTQKGRQIVFLNASSGVDSRTVYFWSFGDGDTATKENTSHQYSSDGIYSVVLKVTSNYKSYSYSKSNFVSLAQIPTYDTIAPIPSFSYYYIGSTVYFVNTSSYTTSATTYLWNFGDTNTDTKENPSHLFANGNFTVVLKVTNSKYTLSCSQQLSVPYLNNNYDWNMKPVAKFVYSQDGKGIYFQNASSNTIPNTKYLWTFGDSVETSDTENPSHIYAIAGKYSVVLKVTNDNISDSYALEVTIP